MNMTLAQVTDLAATIHADDRFIVIAIGRFMLLEELVQPGASGRPWGLTVLPRDKPERRVTLWSPEQWTEYRDLVLEDVAAPATATQLTPQPLVERATPTEDQLLLF